MGGFFSIKAPQAKPPEPMGLSDSEIFVEVSGLLYKRVQYLLHVPTQTYFHTLFCLALMPVFCKVVFCMLVRQHLLTKSAVTILLLNKL